jgi:hypothetical protein
MYPIQLPVILYRQRIHRQLLHLQIHRQLIRLIVIVNEIVMIPVGLMVHYVKNYLVVLIVNLNQMIYRSLKIIIQAKHLFVRNKTLRQQHHHNPISRHINIKTLHLLQSHQYLHHKIQFYLVINYNFGQIQIVKIHIHVLHILLLSILS